MTPAGMGGVLNDAVSVYFVNVTLASAFEGDKTSNTGPSSASDPIATKKRHSLKGVLRREREGRRLPKATCTGTRHSQRPKPALAAVRDWRSAGTGPPIRFNRRLDRDGSARSRRQ
jgi:hypothetical protein